MSKKLNLRVARARLAPPRETPIFPFATASLDMTLDVAIGLLVFYVFLAAFGFFYLWFFVS